MAEPIGRREANKQATRAGLRSAAKQLFASQGYERTTVRDIAQLANVTERTFYRYFDGKEDLVADEFRSWLGMLKDAIVARPAAEPALTAVRRALQSVARQAGLSAPPGPLWLVSAWPAGGETVAVHGPAAAAARGHDRCSSAGQAAAGRACGRRHSRPGLRVRGSRHCPDLRGRSTQRDYSTSGPAGRRGRRTCHARPGRHARPGCRNHPSHRNHPGHRNHPSHRNYPSHRNHPSCHARPGHRNHPRHPRSGACRKRGPCGQRPPGPARPRLRDHNCGQPGAVVAARTLTGLS